jgi:F-type H+-transporting ATPase subunit delta
VIDQTVVSRYARALFALAEEQNATAEADKGLETVQKLTEQHPSVLRLISNPTISVIEKKDFIEKFFAGSAPKIVVHFLNVLLEKKRISELAPVQLEFRRLFEAKKGIKEVTALSAVEISPANLEKLKTVLAKKLSSEIRIKTEVDPDLIGGLIVRFDGKEVNASFRARLDEVRQRLI